jgi:hypothetical protein
VIGDQASVGFGTNIFLKTDITGGAISLLTDLDSTGRVAANTANLSGITFTPEYRFYPSGEAPKGFYINPFVRILTYKTALDVAYTDNSGDITDVESTFRLLTAGPGLSVGYQWLIADRITIEWNGGAGLTFGVIRYKGSIADGQLGSDPQEFLDELNMYIQENTPIGRELTLQDADALKFTLPGAVWPVLRSNLTIGFAF